MSDYWYEDGTCPIPQFFPEEVDEIVIYDHEGNPFTRHKIKMGFDLSVE